MRFIFTIIILTALAQIGQAQRLVRKGNELYDKHEYKQAAAAYIDALKAHPESVTGSFNLGNSLIQQKQFDAARKVMDQTAKTATDPNVKSGAQYNKGNTFMSEQQWQEAINSYKESLRKNPLDADAKYNLSYAREKLKQQQKNGGGKDKNKDNKDDKKQDEKQQKGNDKKDDKDAKEGDNKQQHQQSKPQPGKLTEQQADNLLKALQQDERKTQDKLQQAKASPVKLEKDW